MSARQSVFAAFSLVFSLCVFLTGCASNEKQYNDAMLEKYPGCYHKNFAIYEKCIQKNEAGETTTALELENKAYPGQYQQKK